MIDLKKIKKLILEGDYNKSSQILEKILFTEKNNIEALYLLAVTNEKNLKYQKAIKIYKKLIKKKDNHLFYDNLGKIYIKLNKFTLANNCFSKSIIINPENPNTYNIFGVTLAMLNKENLAIKNFKKAITLNNNFVDPIYNLMEIYEKANNFIELEKIIKHNLSIFPNNKIILFFHSYVLEKNKNVNEAINLLKKINFEKTSLEWEVKKKFRIGELFQKNNQFNNAFKLFKEANKLTLRNINKNIFLNNAYINVIEKNIEYSKKKAINNKDYKKNYNFDLYFHVGFPRSGTTLLDNILRSHSKINILEEAPLIENMLKNLEIDYNTIFSNRTIESAEKLYLKELKNFFNLKTLNNKIFIDKLPLNLTKIKLIHHLLPHAKFIISLRHPLDCIVSCFTQNFALNSAMVNFLDLERTALVYDKIMRILKNSQDISKKFLYYLKYEDLILNTEKNLNELLKFLKLENETNFLNINILTNTRERIRTPSYNQVIKPIYKSSINKWKNYEKEIFTIKPIVKEWIKYFKY